MDLEIRPEPTEEERAAIVEAVLRALGEAGRARVDPWWLAGVRDEGDARSEADGPLSGPSASEASFG